MCAFVFIVGVSTDIVLSACLVTQMAAEHRILDQICHKGSLCTVHEQGSLVLTPSIFCFFIAVSMVRDWWLVLGSIAVRIGEKIYVSKENLPDSRSFFFETIYYLRWIFKVKFSTLGTCKHPEVQKKVSKYFPIITLYHFFPLISYHQ